MFQCHLCSGTARRNTGFSIKNPARRFGGHVKKKINFWYRPKPPISSKTSSNFIFIVGISKQVYKKDVNSNNKL